MNVAEIISKEFLGRTRHAATSTGFNNTDIDIIVKKLLRYRQFARMLP